VLKLLPQLRVWKYCFGVHGCRDGTAFLTTPNPSKGGELGKLIWLIFCFMQSTQRLLPPMHE
jgi:hypothetical protein